MTATSESLNAPLRSRAEAQRDIAVATLRRLRDINLGPDLASASYRCEEVAAIAKDALDRIASLDIPATVVE